MSHLRPAALANPRAISTRIRSKHRVATNNQRNHDLRLGRQPGYVDGDRTARNRVLLANLTGGELRLICDQRREASGQVRQRKVSDSAAVSVAGIITFGTQAQGWVEALPAERQDGLFREVADAIAERLGTTLHGLVVHLDESAIHAHYQLAAITRAGGPVSKVATKAVLNQLQDIAAAVAQRHEPRIERGHRKVDRLAAGAKPSEVVNRSVRQLHQDLPVELEALKQRIEDSRDKLAKNERLAKEARYKVATLADDVARSEAARKRAETYDRRVDAARVDLEAAEASWSEIQAKVDASRAALAETEAKQAALASTPAPAPPRVDVPPRVFLPMSSITPEAWAAEQSAVTAAYGEAVHAREAALRREYDREKSEWLRQKQELQRSHGIRIRRRQEEEAAEKARAAELAAGRRAIEQLKQIDASRRPLDLAEVLESLDFTAHSGGVWRGAAGMALKLGDAGKWQFRSGKEAAIKAGRGALDLVVLILGSFERAVLHLCHVFGFERLRPEVEAAATRAVIDRDQPPPSMPDGPSM